MSAEDLKALTRWQLTGKLRETLYFLEGVADLQRTDYLKTQFQKHLAPLKEIERRMNERERAGNGHQ